MTIDDERDGIIDPRRYVPGGTIEHEFFSRSILATFPDRIGAQSAAEELKRAGYETQVDEVNYRPAEHGTVLDQAFPSTLTGAPDRDRRVLAAADPSISGNALGGGSPIGGHHYLLTVVVEDGAFDHPLEIVRKHGGNPDTGGPR